MKTTIDDPMETEEAQTKKKKKKSKKEKKAKKEKRKRKRDESNDETKTGVGESDGPEKKEEADSKDDADPSVVKGIRKKKDTKKEKKKKKKKKSKNESDKESSDEEESSSTSGENMDDPSPAAASGDSRLVASSAIEFYDADFKKNAKKRQKLTKDIGSSGSSSTKNGSEEDAAAENDHQNSKKTDEEHNHSLTLLLFYQYIEPVWDDDTYDKILRDLKKLGTSLELTGRMRCAKEGLNCSLTGAHSSILEYTRALRQLRPNDFGETEFKLTTDLPLAQKFGELKVLPVLEIVRYGLEGQKAPPIQQYSGVHLEPKDYHKKLAESNTVIIDVRNHYEAAIGRFVPPSEQGQGGSEPTKEKGGDDPRYIDPKMRKSTEFPAWLDKDETKELMKGKQVLMYCTGGIRCERASALLKYKMETDPSVKDLNIKGVFQLQGGIDKYFKEFPDGGYWQGKNYVFDKRFAHAPPKIDGELHGRARGDGGDQTTNSETVVAKAPVVPTAMGKCESCHKPWDMYRGKRRCPTCGVPSLICKECFLADKNGTMKLGREVRCDLCVEQNIFSKRDYREKDERFISSYESKMRAKGLLLPSAVGTGRDSGGSAGGNNGNDDGSAPTVPNPKKITRLVLKNMCKKNMNEDALVEALPGITHISWNTYRNRKNPGSEPIFTGMGWVEMATPEDAARAVARNNKMKVFNRPLGIAFQPPDGKDVWPPPKSRVA